MDLDNDELKATKENATNEKYVPLRIYTEVYDKMCKYMELYNTEVDKNDFLEAVIKEMSKQLTTPISGPEWTVDYYKKQVAKKMDLKHMVDDMLE